MCADEDPLSASSPEQLREPPHCARSDAICALKPLVVRRNHPRRAWSARMPTSILPVDSNELGESRMIDLTTETVLSFKDACKKLPKRRAGKRPHIATLYRWATRGLRGIQLEYIQIGGTMCTSMEALQRFFDRLGAKEVPKVGPSSTSRNSQIQQAAQRLRKQGVG